MFIIKDWAGNRVFEDKFDSFDDAWDYLLAEFPNEDDDYFSEYFVQMIGD